MTPTEATNTNRPSLLASRSGSAAWAQSNAAVKLVAMIRSQLSRVIFANGAPSGRLISNGSMSR